MGFCCLCACPPLVVFFVIIVVVVMIVVVQSEAPTAVAAHVVTWLVQVDVHLKDFHSYD